MRRSPAAFAFATLLLAAPWLAGDAASAGLTSTATLVGPASFKTGRERREAEAIFALALGDGAFRLDLAPCYSVTGTTKPKGKGGTQLRLLVDDASRDAWREFLVLFASRAGTGPATASRDRTKLVLTSEGSATATLALKARLTARKAKATSVKGTLTGPLTKVAGTPPPLACRFDGPSASQPLALTAQRGVPGGRQPRQQLVSLLRPARRTRTVRIADGAGAGRAERRRLPAGRQQGLRRQHRRAGPCRVIPTDHRQRHPPAASLHIPVGAEPYGSSPRRTARRSTSRTPARTRVSVIDTATDTVDQDDLNAGPRAARSRGHQRRRLPMTLDEKLYVTSVPVRAGPGKLDGADDAKQGRVTVVATATNTVVRVRVPAIRSPIPGSTPHGDALAPDPARTELHLPDRCLSESVEQRRDSAAALPTCRTPARRPTARCASMSTRRVCSRRSVTTTDQDANVTINMHKWRSPIKPACQSCSSRNRGRSRSSTARTKATW